MTNRKVEATFHPGSRGPRVYVGSTVQPGQIYRAVNSSNFRVAIRRMERLFYNLSWALRNGKLTDDERLVLRWITRHRTEGRMDLVEEDLLWLGKRLEKR